MSWYPEDGAILIAIIAGFASGSFLIGAAVWAVFIAMDKDLWD